MLNLRSTILSAAAVVLALFLWGASAQAAPYSVTGQYDQSCCNFPNLGGGAVPIITFPLAGGGGGVTIQEGNGPPTQAVSQVWPGGTLTVPANVFDVDVKFTNNTPTAPPSALYLYTNVQMNNAAAQLKPGSGPGNVSYCLYAAGNPNCTGPGAGVGYNGLLQHVANTPNFGGTMTLLGGLIDIRLTITYGSPGITIMNADPGNQSTVGNAFSNYFTQPIQNTIMTPGGTTTIVTPGRGAGLPWGTGMVYAVATGQPFPYFPTISLSYSGSDNRNTTGPNVGEGNITLVSATISAIPAQTFLWGHRLVLNVPEPGSTAMMAGGLGMLFVVARMRRNGRP